MSQSSSKQSSSKQSKCKWVIVRRGDDQERLAEAVTASGRQCKLISLKEAYEGTKLPRRGTNTVIYGSIGVTQYLSLRQGWTPGAWFERQPFRCVEYYSHWREHILQRNYILLPIIEVFHRFQSLVREYGDGEKLFVRPDDNNKVFNGYVVGKNNYDEWRKTLEQGELNPATLTVVAKPEKIIHEWRLIMRQGKFVTGSQYTHFGEHFIQPFVPLGMIEFAESLPQYDGLPPVYVLDVGIISIPREQGSMNRVIEIGSINCAGLYDSDTEKIVQAVSEEAEREYLENSGPRMGKNRRANPSI